MKTNNRIAFYSAILNYLQSEFDDEGMVKKIIDLSNDCSPSWEATADSIADLEQYVNRGSEIENEDELFTLLNDFVKDAFKDLSVLKNPAAMELFHKLAVKVLPSFRAGEDIFIWAKSVKERPDGSGIIMLHVTDLERFRKELQDHDLIDGSTENYTLEEVIQLGS
jgi:hypothetical protein